MRQFASSGFRIWNLSREAKLVYTAFGLCSLLALFVSAAFYEDLVGNGSAGVQSYYAGGPAAAPPAVSDKNAPGGPQIALPDEEAARPITVAMPYRKLLEVTHFHLFTVPVYLLIIAHLFMLTGLSSTAKTLWIAAAWLAALVHLAAPWAVRYAGAGFAPTYVWSGVALGVTCTVLTGYPIVAMWTGRTRPAPAAVEKNATS